jgi:hypothetical protein
MADLVQWFTTTVREEGGDPHHNNVNGTDVIAVRREERCACPYYYERA